jgi:hypothetical protein
MNMNKWTLGLAALGVVSLASAVQAEEAMNVVKTTLSATTLSGYVNTSAWLGPDTGTIDPAIPLSQGKGNGFNLDLVKVSLSKPLDEQNWSAGYKVDLDFGSDAAALNTWGNNENYALQNAFVALRAPVGNGLVFKMGVFDAVLGYETFDAGNNPNYTRSYGWGMEPTTMTGLLATYKFNDWFAASAGIADTYGATINQRAYTASGQNWAQSYMAYTGSVAFSIPKDDHGWLGGSALYAGIINGYNSSPLNSAPTGAVQQNYYVGMTMNTPLKAVKVGASYDYAGNSQTVTPTYAAAWANAASAYISWQAMEKLGIYSRSEYSWRSMNATMAGLPSKVFAQTITVQYDLWENVLSRLELRWDHSANGLDAYSNASNQYGLKNAYTLALNVIYKF